MRKRHSMVGVIAVVAACGDGTEHPQDAARADAAAVDGPDVDGPVVDAMPDAISDASPDAGPAIAATIHITREYPPGSPSVDARVAVVEAGLPTVVYTVDASGTVVVPLQPHAQVWVHADDDIFAKRIFLIEDVSPGDVLNLGAPPITTPTNVGSVTIHYTPLPGSYVFTAGYYNRPLCGAGDVVSPSADTFTVSWESGCEVHSGELVITALDSSTFVPHAFLYVPDVSSGSPGAIDATGLSWDTTPDTYTETFTGLAGVEQAWLRVVSDASWWNVVGGVVDVSGGSGSDSFVAPSILTPAVVMYDLEGPAATPTSQYGDDPAPTLPGELGVDGATLLPMITSSYSVADQTFHWSTIAPGGVAPQLVTAQISDTAGHLLRIYAPATVTSIAIPDVPDELTTDDGAWTDANRNLYLVYAEGSTYRDLLTDIDHHRSHINEVPYRPSQRNRWSGGFTGN